MTFSFSDIQLFVTNNFSWHSALVTFSFSDIQLFVTNNFSWHSAFVTLSFCDIQLFVTNNFSWHSAFVTFSLNMKLDVCMSIAWISQDTYLLYHTIFWAPFHLFDLTKWGELWMQRNSFCKLRWQLRNYQPLKANTWKNTQLTTCNAHIYILLAPPQCQHIEQCTCRDNTIKGGIKKEALFRSLWLRGGWGVGQNVKRLRSYLLNHVLVGVFQYVPGPPKHVLHLVWSDNVISTAVRTASKVAWRAKIPGKTR